VSTSDLTAGVLELLERERAGLLTSVGQVPEALRNQRPSPEHWSVAEILEHLATVERLITSLIATRGREPPLEPVSPAILQEARLSPAGAARIRDRAERVEAPDRIRPAGQLGPAEALEALTATRAALVAAFLAADPAALDGVTARHPVIGLLTLRGWVMSVGHQEARHAAQVAEIADALR
jgi:DinB superfamily